MFTAAGVTPDAPYWLDSALTRGTGAGMDIAGRSSLSMVFCGITDRDMFRRQMMKAAFLEDILDLAGQDELVVLLPRGLFDPQAGEIQALTRRGWNVMWTPAGQECPEAFGQRLAGLRGECVMTCPTGYDVDPDFVISGLHAMKGNPGLTVYGGHLAIDDAASGRAVAIRAFG